ncbi:MAG TPA: hypothetical protein VF916_08395 [Ktedonobacterales bacterium]
MPWAQAASGWSAPAAQPRARRGMGCLWAFLLTLVLLSCAVVGGWAAVVRPAIHAQVDRAIGTALDTAVANVPAVPAEALQLVGPTFVVTEADTNAALQHDLPATGKPDELAVSYLPGAVEVRYLARGWRGTIQTTLLVRSGQLVATNTRVSGILAWVETGAELQSTVNQALTQLEAKTPFGFEAVAITTGHLAITLKTA